MHDPEHQSLKPTPQVGLRCLKCGHGKFRVIYTRGTRDGKIVRRRECRACGTRLSTRESIIGGVTGP